jgi:hypothetical protein
MRRRRPWTAWHFSTKIRDNKPSAPVLVVLRSCRTEGY